METVEYKNISFTVWDVGGQDKVLSVTTVLVLSFMCIIFKTVNTNLHWVFNINKCNRRF